MISIQFPEGNTRRFGQDMQFWEGVPSSVTFTLVEVCDYCLVMKAPGYGEKGAYGNGAIYVFKKPIKT